MKEYTLGILDEEEDEIDLIQTCFEDHFNISPIKSIKSIEELIEIIKQEKIDVISIDYKLRDHNSDIPHNGDYFFNELFEKFGDFPAFVLTRDVANARHQSKKISPRFIVDKMDIHNFVTPNFKKEKEKFIDDLKLEIEVHKNKIEEDSQELSSLQIMLNEQGNLTSEEENRYIELNHRLSKSISGHSQVPITYFSKQTNDKLDFLIEKTEDLLQKLDTQND